MLIKQNIHVTVDAVVFGYADAQLQLLLISRKAEPFKGSWALPGGFVLNDESPETAVTRELQEETGVTVNYLEQLYSFGAPDRDPRFRTISIAYFGLVNPQNFSLAAATDAADAKWFAVDALPRLAFDHKAIVKKALERLRAKLQYEPVGFELLGRKFQFSEMENLYATVLGREIDRRNFRKKIMGLGILKELEETGSRGAGRPGKLYSFDKKQYAVLKKSGMYLELL